MARTGQRILHTPLCCGSHMRMTDCATNEAAAPWTPICSARVPAAGKNAQSRWHARAISSSVTRVASHPSFPLSQSHPLPAERETLATGYTYPARELVLVRVLAAVLILHGHAAERRVARAAVLRALRRPRLRRLPQALAFAIFKFCYTARALSHVRCIFHDG
eukprot:3938700-Rhodomonas_salina.5